MLENLTVKGGQRYGIFAKRHTISGLKVATYRSMEEKQLILETAKLTQARQVTPLSITIRVFT